MPIGIDMNNYDISMGTGQIRMSGGGTFTSDNSINYDWILRASPPDYTWFSVVYGAGLFVAMGYYGGNNSVMTSPDGINWTLRTTPGQGWRSVVYGNGIFVAVGDGGSSRIMTSTNGITWTASNQFTSTTYLYVTYGLVNGTTPTFVAVGHTGTNRIIYSTNNGTTWEGITTYDTIALYSCAFGNGRFVALSTSAPYALYSSNGISWTQTNLFQVGKIWNGATYGNGLFVAVCGTGGNGTGGQQLTSRVATSTDGITWTNRYAPDNTALTGVAYGGGIFVALGNGGSGYRTITSTDGITWTSRPSANDSVGWRQITYGNGIFVAVASSGSGAGTKVMTLDPACGMSINKITTEETTTNLVKFGQNGATISANPSKNFAWVARSAAEANGWNWVCYGNGTFVATAIDGTNRVMTSTDGYTWVGRSAATSNQWVSVCYGELSENNLYVAVANNGTNRIMYSSNGVTWASSNTSVTINLVGVCFGYDTSGNGRFVSVANSGTGGRVMISSNGINWEQRTTPNDTTGWSRVCYGYDSSGQGQFVSVAYSGTGVRSMYSINGGGTWTGVTTIDDNSVWIGICYGNGTFVAVADGGAAGRRVMYSRNIIGSGWTAANYTVDNGWYNVCFGNGLFVAVANSGTGNRVMTSPDGINWTIRASTEDNNWTSVCYGNGTFVAVSYNGTNRVMTNDYTANDNMLVLNGGISSNVVGIGTTTPAYTLDVNGTVKITGQITADGKVGIGTINPGSTLHVSFGSNNGMLHTSCVSNQTAASTALNTIYPASTIFGPSCTDSQLVFYSKTNNQSQLRFFLTGVAFFTGQHAVVMDKPEITQNLDDYVGLIISSNDTGCTSYYNGVKYTGIDAIRINESLPNCKLSDTDNDKAVYGVITNQKNDEYFDDSGNPMYDNTDDGFDRQLFDRVRVNSVGEGSIWVTNINGNIENGDYITSSIIPGYGKKQNDDILHSYTVGKSIMSCDFSITSTRYKTKTIEFNGQTYIAAFIGCTYHCG